MPLDEDLLIKVRLRALRATLEELPATEKKSPATTSLAEQFNALAREVGERHPEVKSALPVAIGSTGPFGRMGFSDVRYIELEVCAEQVLAILDLLE